MPVPSGNCSSRRRGGGFVVSNARKSIKPTRSVFQETGAAIRVISWPATSSITTQPGSSRPSSRATLVAAGIPTAIATPARAIVVSGCQDGGIQCASHHHSNTVAAEPHVPGDTGRRPEPKNVATTQAQARARGWFGAVAKPSGAASSSVLFILWTGLGYVITCILHGRRNQIIAACPFSQID